MAVFRIERTKDYTVMSNYHLRDKSLSLKAKGLLSQMLSLPEDWDYTLTGLSIINRESKDAIRSAVNELEQAGYIRRHQTVDAKGKFSVNEYIIYEQPQPRPSGTGLGRPDGSISGQPLLDSPLSENPTTGNPSTENPLPENPTQLNIDITSKDQQKTDLPSTHSFLSSETAAVKPPEAKRSETRQRDMEIYREIIRENICYESLLHDLPYDHDRIDEIIELMVETVCSTRKYIRVAGEDCPADVVKSRLLKLDAEHIKFVFDCLKENTTKVRNIKQYLLTTLFNAPTTIGNYYGGRLPVHVRCLIDEAANIGQIPQLEKLVATIRSREISACLILQAQSQLKALYKDNADTIVGNMDARIFLGGSEPTKTRGKPEL